MYRKLNWFETNWPTKKKTLTRNIQLHGIQVVLTRVELERIETHVTTSVWAMLARHCSLKKFVFSWVDFPRHSTTPFVSPRRLCVSLRYPAFFYSPLCFRPSIVHPLLFNSHDPDSRGHSTWFTHPTFRWPHSHEARNIQQYPHGYGHRQRGCSVEFARSFRFSFSCPSSCAESSNMLLRPYAIPPLIRIHVY